MESRPAESRRTSIVPLGLALLLCVGRPAPAQPREVVETFEDGTARARYKVDADGLRTGLCIEYHPGGSVRCKSVYRKGQLNGRYEELFADGQRKVLTNYDDGKLDGGFVELRPDGTRALVTVYRKGEIHGRYQSFHADGTPAVDAQYRLGKLHGRRFERSEDGSRVLTENHRDGLFDGERVLEVHGVATCTQVWKAGALQRIDGIEPYPRAKADLLATLRTILGNQAADPEAELGGQREMALRRLRAYRHLCGVPWEDLSLDESLNVRCQAAAEVMHQLGRLDHHPLCPPGMPAERFMLGKEGAEKSNLAQDDDLPATVDGYMDDSDPSNIVHVGHRRWCLNPAMRRTGFGWKERWSAMWAWDESGPVPRGIVFVAFPPPGNVPRDFFEPHIAWSVSFFGNKGFVTSASVEVHRLDATWLPSGPPLEIADRSLDLDGPLGATLVFRPLDASCKPGARYRVRLRNETKQPGSVVYVVEFAEPVGGIGRPPRSR